MTTLGAWLAALGSIAVGMCVALTLVPRILVVGPPDARAEKSWTEESAAWQRTYLDRCASIARVLWIPSVLVFLTGLILLAVS